MSTVQLVVQILLILLLICIALMFYVRLSRHLEEKGRAERRKKIADIFTKTLQKNEVIEIGQIPTACRRFEDVLPVVETFDRTYSDPNWQASRKQLLEHYLLPEARRTLHSHIWQKRQLALRAIALDPHELVNEADVLHLLNDSHYLVRIVAASCLIKSEKEHLLLPVIERMGQESPMARYPYRDLLMSSPAQTYDWLKEIALNSDDPEVLKVCLDILATRISPNLLPVIEKELDSPDLACRATCIKMLGNLPTPRLREYLESCLDDNDWQIRAEAAESLGKNHALASIPKLALLLNDEEWLVRLKAAVALKSMGKEGWAVLYEQDKEKDPEAYEIAEYVRALP